jgi:hypothetical protein
MRINLYQEAIFLSIFSGKPYYINWIADCYAFHGQAIEKIIRKDQKQGDGRYSAQKPAGGCDLQERSGREESSG